MEDEAARPLRSSEQPRRERGCCEPQIRRSRPVRRSSSSTVLSYNYAVRYDADDEQQHWLTEPRYVGNNVASAENDWSGMDAHPPGSWAVFTTSVLPRAPQAGRTTALRAAPPEIIALGGAEQRRRL